MPACDGGLAGWAEYRGLWRTAQLVDVGLADVHAMRTSVRSLSGPWWLTYRSGVPSTVS